MISEHTAAGLLTSTITSLWVGGLVSIGVTLSIRWLHMRAQARYRLWVLALIITVSAPLLRIPSQQPAERVSGTDASVPAETVSTAGAGAEERPAGTTGSVSPASPDRPVTVSLDADAGKILLLAWAVGAIAGLALLGLQMIALISLKRSGSIPGAHLAAIWNAVAPNMGRRSVRLLTSTQSRLPAALGYFRAVILAPDSLCRRLTGEETRHLLLHELAHLNRYDDWWLLVHRLVQAVLWWHPVIWFLSRKLDGERELACDEIVIEKTSRRQYARTLVRVAEVASGNSIALAPGVLRGDLTRRIESLLQVTARPGRSARTRAGVAAASTIVLAVWLSPPSIRLALDAVPGPGPGVSDRTRIASQLDSLFAGYADSGFAGSILLAVGDEVVLSKGYGLADRERMIPATAETRYSVAGFTKMFTAAAILTLEHEGRLRVTDSLARFFNGLTGLDGQVTLHQLLTHTDGMTRQNAPVYRENAAAFIRAVSASPDSFAPGEGYRYNDFGHSVLGVIIGQAGGSTYEEYIHNRFLTPAGLSQTRFENEPGESYATEYAGAKGRQYPIPRRSYTWGRRGSLGMVSTVGDMYRWILAMDDPRVLAPEVKARMMEVHGPTDWGADRGYGWDRLHRPDGAIVWRRVAGTPGMEGEILHDPVLGWTAIILVNSRVEWRFRVWDDISDAIRRSQDRVQ